MGCLQAGRIKRIFVVSVKAVSAQHLRPFCVLLFVDLLAYLAVTGNHKLLGGQRLQAHRAIGMQLTG